MRIWFASAEPPHLERESNLVVLLSYYDLQLTNIPFRKELWKLMKKKKKKVSLFLDSGAFSAFTQGIAIDIQEYIKFIKEHKEFIDIYANLDVIGNAKGTLKNQRIMEKAGLNPLPCFHQGEDYKYLKYYLDNYDYIALGGLAGNRYSTWEVFEHLTRCFQEYICDQDGMPKVKVHGFGMTSWKFMRHFPWYSVDSTSWILTGRNGSILMPRKRNGEYIYTEDPIKVNISNKSPKVKEAGKHLINFSKREQEVILEYIKSKGFKVGESEIYDAPSKDYTLKEGEKWFGKEEADSQREIIEILHEYIPVVGWSKDKKIEKVIEEGLCNSYWLRDQLNLIYYLDFQNSIPKWPWPFKVKSKNLGVF